MNNTRVYRPFEPSDLVNIQQGKLKVFWKVGNSQYFPARLVSTRCAYWGGNLFIYDNGQEDVPCNSASIVIDITPKKKYAIWAHKTQRFAADYFSSRQEAEIALQEMFGKYATPESQRKAFYIVEWEIKSDD